MEISDESAETSPEQDEAVTKNGTTVPATTELEPETAISPPVDPIESLEAGAPSLAAITQQIALSQAADLARVGQYSQAEALLDSLQGEETPEVLDLKARIRAQQGRLAEAQSLWERALTIDPGNPDYLQGLEYVQKAQIPVRTKRIFTTGFWLGLALILALIIGVIWLSRWNQAMQSTLTEVSKLAQEANTAVSNSNKTAALIQTPELAQGVKPATAPAIPSEPGISAQDLEKFSQELIGAVSTNQNSLADQVAQLKSGQAEILAGLQPTSPEEQALQFDLAGVQLIPGFGDVQIRFDEGLFAYGWTLKPAARQLLTQLGSKLAPFAENLQINLVGFQSEAESDKYFDLGLLRAVVVYDFLVSNTQLPSEVFIISPQGARPLPFPLDSAANRSRNMTIEMIVSQERP